MKTLAQFLEESVQIDELSRKTLASYHDKAGKSERSNKRKQLYHRYAQNAPAGRPSLEPSAEQKAKDREKEDSYGKKVAKRKAGQKLAMSKLAREETVNEGCDIELKPHPTKKTHYVVHKIHSKSGIGRDQLKTGEHLSDTHVDDLHDMGYKVKIHKK